MNDEETVALIAATERFLKRRITVYMPQAGAVEHYICLNGINGFYESITQRQQCCEVRKLDPLKRALHGKDAWLTGLRRTQSTTRAQLDAVAFDVQFNLTKISPLLEWSEAQTWDYAREHGIPTNPLHAQGFRSIGCAPCTRATAEGEDVRAGRWWWEAAEHKECGLHKAGSERLGPGIGARGSGFLADPPSALLASKGFSSADAPNGQFHSSAP